MTALPPPTVQQIGLLAGLTTISSGSGADTVQLTGSGTLDLRPITITGIAQISHTGTASTVALNMFNGLTSIPGPVGGTIGDVALSSISGSGQDTLSLSGTGMIVDLAQLHVVGFSTIALPGSGTDNDTLAASPGVLAGLFNLTGDASDMLSLSGGTSFDLSFLQSFSLGKIALPTGATLIADGAVIAGVSSITGSSDTLALAGGGVFASTVPGSGAPIFDLSTKKLTGITSITHPVTLPGSVIVMGAGELVVGSGIATITGDGSDTLGLAAGQIDVLTGVTSFGGFTGIQFDGTSTAGAGSSLTTSAAQLAGITRIGDTNFTGGSSDTLTVTTAGAANVDLSGVKQFNIGSLYFDASFNAHTVTLDGAALTPFVKPGSASIGGGVQSIVGSTSETVNFVINEPTTVPAGLQPYVRLPTFGNIAGASVTVSGSGILQTDINNFQNTVSGTAIGAITATGSNDVLMLTGTGTVTISGISSIAGTTQISGFQTLNLGVGEQIVVGSAGSATFGLPTGITSIFGAGNDTVNVTGSISGGHATIDLSGVNVSGPVAISGTTSINGSAVTAGQTFTITDANLAGNLFANASSIVGGSTVSLAGMTFTGHQAAVLFSHGFATVSDSSGGYSTVSSGIAGITDIMKGAAVQSAALVDLTQATLTGTALSLPAGVTQLVLTSPGQANFTLDMSADTISAGGSGLVLFGGKENLTLTLPNALVGGQPVTYVGESGSDTVTSGTAPALIFGGNGGFIHLGSGGGSVVGGAGFATIDAGTANGTGYGVGTAATVWGSFGGSAISGGGEYSELISRGSGTIMTASTTALHQFFDGDTIGGTGACDSIFLSQISGAQDIVLAGNGNTSVTTAAGDATIEGGIGFLSIASSIGGGSGSLTYIGSTTTSERTNLGGNAYTKLYAQAGSGADTLSASAQGNSTIVGGTGNNTIFGSTGNALIFTQGSAGAHDAFQFADTASTAHVGTFVVHGANIANDGLQITVLQTADITTVLASQHQVTLTLNPQDPNYDANIAALLVGEPATVDDLVIGQQAMQITLTDGQKIDFIGITSQLTASGVTL